MTTITRTGAALLALAFFLAACGGDDAPVADQTDGSVRLGPRGGASKGRVQIHVPAKDPTEPVNPDCVVAATLGEIETYFWRAVDRGDEGLIIKDLGSKWEPGARGDSWLKIKPDYLPTEDLDVVIIGGFYGTGRQRGGKIAEYLLGIVETPTREGARPTRVMSFSKVGTGMSVDVIPWVLDVLPCRPNLTKVNVAALGPGPGDAGLRAGGDDGAGRRERCSRRKDLDVAAPLDSSLDELILASQR